MQVRLFGELEAEQAGVPVPVRGAKQRALLALLALRPGQPVSADRLIDVLWGDGQAANPANALQAQVGQLRRTFGPDAVITTEAGYALDVGPEDVDLARFEQLVAQGRRMAEAGQAADASAALGEALGLRRGEPLADFTHAGLLDAERTRLDELILVAIETRAGADLVLGRHGEVAAELEAWCPGLLRVRGGPAAGRVRRRHPGLLDRARGHPEHARPSRRGAVALRAGIAAPGEDEQGGSVLRGTADMYVGHE